jgi:signal transduction histidine kinase
VLLLAAVYVAAGRLGLLVHPVSGFATLVWPTTGIALTALLLGGIDLWPGVAIGAFAVNLWTGASVGAALGMGAGNTLEAVLAAWGLGRAGFRPQLARVRDVIALIAIGAFASTAVSATIGVASLWASGVVKSAEAAVTWRAWWLGDAMSDLVMAPLLLAWARGAARPARRAAEALSVGGVVGAVGVYVLLGWPAVGGTLREPFLLFPVIIWAALRFGPRGATSTTFVLSAMAIAGATRGTRSPEESLVFVQSFMAVVAVTTLLLAAAAEERSEAVRARDRLLAIVAHDLKSPLSAITLTAHRLKKLADEPVAEKGRVVIQRSADRMARLIDDLVDLSAIDAGRLATQLAAEAVAAPVNEAVEAVRPLAAARKIRIDIEIPEGIPMVMGDRERLVQALVNLIGNAIKFSPEEGAIAVRVKAEERAARFTVADCGPGVPGPLRRTLFQPWVRGEVPGAGTGLGLAITRGIVEAHRGRLWLDGTVAGGATFHFTVPFAERKS